MECRICGNDINNKDLPSYIDGKAIIINLADERNPERKIRLMTFRDGAITDSQIITIKLPYLENISGTGATNISNSGSQESISAFDKTNMDRFASDIRSLEAADRIYLMQKYNLLLENWDDTTEKAKILIDMQTYIEQSAMTSTQKTSLSGLIDTILV